MAEDVLTIKLEAILSDFKAQLAEAAGAMQQSKASMENGFKDVSKSAATTGKEMGDTFKKAGSDMTSSLGAAFDKFKGYLIGIGAALLGGKIFKDAIEKTIEWGTETRKLNTYLGGTYQETGAVIMAAKAVGIPFETLTSITMALNRNLTNSPEKFKEMEIAVRDTQTGALLPMIDILLNTVNRLKEFEEGTSRANAGQYILARGSRELHNVLKLNANLIEEYRVKLLRLGINFEEIVPMTTAYKRALADVHLQADALKVKLGVELMPALTIMGRFFGEVGPPLIKGFVTILQSLDTFLHKLAYDIAELRILFTYSWEIIAKSAVTAWEVMKTACTSGFAEAKRVAAEGFAEIGHLSANMAKEVQKNSEDAAWAIQRIFAKSPYSVRPGYKIGIMGMEKVGPEKPPGEEFDPTKMGAGGGESIVAKWRAELEEIKLLSEKLLETTLEDDKKYWEEKLELCKEGSKEYKEVQHQVLMLTKQIAREEYQERLADIKAQMADERKNSLEKIALQDVNLKDALKNYGKDSAEYKNQLAQKKQMLQQYENEQRQLRISAMEHQHSLYKIEAEMAREYLTFQREMGLMNESQVIQGLKRIEMAEFQSERNKLARERAEYKESEKEFQKHTQEIEKLDKKHNANMQKLDQQYTLAVKRQWDQIVSAISGAFSNAIQGLIAGTMTFKQAMVSIFQAIFNALINMIANWVFGWIANLLFAAIFGRITAIQRITQEAGVAFAAAYASTCAIPIIGPALAPEVAAAAAKAALFGGLAIASAAGGWDIPRDSMAMVHGGEMVLPAELADRIRGMTDPGAKGPTFVNFNVQAWDSADVKRFFRRHGNKLADSLVQQARNFHPAASRVGRK